VLDSIVALADFLVSEARIMERGSDQAKKDAKDAVPTDRIKDAAAMARELRWRVKQAAGHGSEDEGSQAKALNGNMNETKRKRLTSDGIDMTRFKNYRPRRWESIVGTPAESEKWILKYRKPQDDEDNWHEGWMNWRDELKEMDDGEEVEVIRRRDVIVKVRRSTNGLERQRVERVVEEWKWNGNDESMGSSSSSDTWEKAKMDIDVRQVVDNVVNGSVADMDVGD
jgi:hypothetical protein